MARTSTTRPATCTGRGGTARHVGGPPHGTADYRSTGDSWSSIDVDLAAEASCEIGEGDVAVAACVEAARAAGIEWLVYEHDDPTDPAASIDTGAAFLKSV